MKVGGSCMKLDEEKISSQVGQQQVEPKSKFGKTVV